MSMSIEKLSVDFKDDIINKDLNELRQYRMVQNPNGTVSFEDVTEYMQIGSQYGMKEVVETNDTVNKIIDGVRFYGIKGDGSLSGMTFVEYREAETNVQSSGWGYAWKDAVSVNRKIYENTFLSIKANTAYRLTIDASGSSIDLDENMARYTVFDAHPRASAYGSYDSIIKDVDIFAQPMAGKKFYIIISNHSEHSTSTYPLEGAISLRIMYESYHERWN